MFALGNLVLAGLLAIAGWSGGADAARTPQQRREQYPYVILPPVGSSGSEVGGGGRGRGSEQLAHDMGTLDFRLQHIYHHGSHKFPRLHRYQDIPQSAQLKVTSDRGETYEPAPSSLRVRSRSGSVQRLAHRKPADIDRLLQHSAIHGEAAHLPASAWTIDSVRTPNVTDRETVLSFARMASNAYVQEHNKGDWQDVGGGYNYTDDFGWEADGLRGHVFADQHNKTIVIGLKGTSPAVFDGADTTGNDKMNDNLFGSCCCGQGGQFLWKQVCDCMTGTYACNSTCLVKSLREKSHYYWAVRDLYHNVTERYPDSSVWLAGHSLGGVVSGLLGLTYGLPTLTFEAFPDALAASRLGLPTPPGYRIGSHQSRFDIPIYHFGHTADPIYMGTCNGASSFCTIAGYAFQGVCHTGKTCTYDTVGDLGWRVGIGTHKITSVIKDVLEKYDTVPVCEEDVECQDCFNWKFFESNGTEPVTSKVSSTTTSSTRTRTETCRTPGWWGCLDESTTSGATTSTSRSTTSSSTSSTSTCKTPGWFGCKDIITTTTTTTSSSASSTTTTPAVAPAPTSSASPPTSTATSCLEPGWFGCNDPSTVAPVSTPAAPSPTSARTTPVATGLLSSITPSISPTARARCDQRAWYGGCQTWRTEL